MGSGTYKELAKYSNNISYMGNHVDVAMVGKEFAELVGSKTCLFPVSNISKRTIQRHFPDQSKAVDLVVYQTFEKTEFENPNANVLIFTSPSNVRAYLASYPIESHQKVIAIGPSTGHELELNKILNYVLPKITGELGLIDLI